MKIITVVTLTLLTNLITISYSFGQSAQENSIEKANNDTEKIKSEQNTQIKTVQRTDSSAKQNEAPKEIVKTLQNKPNQAQSHSISTGNIYNPISTTKEPLSKDEQITQLEKSIQSGESKIALLSDDFESNQLEIEEKRQKVQQWKEELELLKK